jgi:UDP-glucose 4-epimerase
MTILITGAMGFIGLGVAAQLAGQEELLLGYNRNRPADAGLPEPLGSAPAARLDVSSPYSVTRAVREHGVDSIVHLAVPGLGAMPPAEETTTAIGGLVNVLEAAYSSGVRRVTVASSLAVYAGLESGPFHEDRDLPVHSPSATSAMKKAEEILALHYADRTGLDVVLLRIAVIYGPRYHTLANMAGRLVHQAVRGELPAHRAGPWTSKQLGGGLDLCYVTDCARAIARIHTAPTTEHRIYNLGTGRPPVGAAELVEAVRLAVPDAALPTEPLAGAEAAPGDRHMDTARIRDEFGITPEYSVEAGVKEYVDWLGDHPL